MKVFIVTPTAAENDKKALAEAGILAAADLEVVILGLLKKSGPMFERREGFCIKRLNIPSGFIPWARPLFTRLKLFMAVLTEDTDYLHVHKSRFLMFLIFIAAKLKGSRFVADYNNILVLEQKAGKAFYYEQENLWGAEPTEAEKDRIRTIYNLIPEDVHSILDAGCGDGRIINQLSYKYKTSAFDSSAEALKHVTTDKFIADIEKIPVKDNSFNLVICSEVVEHLKGPAYSKAIREITRVSSKYLILAVPNKEQLSIGRSYCPKCKVKFHVNNHYHSFTVKKLSKNLPDFKLLRFSYCGAERLYYHPVLLWIKRYIGGVWSKTQNSICPVCFQKLNPSGFPETNDISFKCDLKNNKLKESKDIGKRHIVALYGKITKGSPHMNNEDVSSSSLTGITREQDRRKRLFELFKIAQESGARFARLTEIDNLIESGHAGFFLKHDVHGLSLDALIEFAEQERAMNVTGTYFFMAPEHPHTSKHYTFKEQTAAMRRIKELGFDTGLHMDPFFLIQHYKQNLREILQEIMNRFEDESITFYCGNTHGNTAHRVLDKNGFDLSFALFEQLTWQPDYPELKDVPRSFIWNGFDLSFALFEELTRQPDYPELKDIPPGTATLIRSNRVKLSDCGLTHWGDGLLWSRQSGYIVTNFISDNFLGKKGGLNTFIHDEALWRYKLSDKQPPGPFTPSVIRRLIPITSVPENVKLSEGARMIEFNSSETNSFFKAIACHPTQFLIHPQFYLH